jgi:hypothetical protein
MVDRGEVAVSAAAAVATLPVEEQEEVVAKGPEAIQATAKKVSRRRKQKSPHQAAHESPGRRWHELLHDLFRLINGVRDVGGIEKVSKKWSQKEHDAMLAQLENLRDVLGSYIDYLRRNV